MAMTVPPVRKAMGWKPADRIPTTFPGEFGSGRAGTDGRDRKSIGGCKLHGSLDRLSLGCKLPIVPRSCRQYAGLTIQCPSTNLIAVTLT